MCHHPCQLLQWSYGVKFFYTNMEHEENDNEQWFTMEGELVFKNHKHGWFKVGHAINVHKDCVLGEECIQIISKWRLTNLLSTINFIINYQFAMSREGTKTIENSNFHNCGIWKVINEKNTHNVKFCSIPNQWKKCTQCASLLYSKTWNYAKVIELLCFNTCIDNFKGGF